MHATPEANIEPFSFTFDDLGRIVFAQLANMGFTSPIATGAVR